jgi:hypothetical protein
MAARSVFDVVVIDGRDASPTASSVAVNALVAIPTAPTPHTYGQSTACVGATPAQIE